MAESKAARRRGTGLRWTAGAVRELRNHLGLTQREMANELGVRQQTVSEWETGQYEPRGGSATLLRIVAERAGFAYDADASATPPGAEHG